MYGSVARTPPLRTSSAPCFDDRAVTLGPEMCQTPDVKRAALIVLWSLLLNLGLFQACSSSGIVTSGDGAAPSGTLRDVVTPDRERLQAPILIDASLIDASCSIRIETPPFLDSPHVEIGTPVIYNSNPPASGPHYPIWAAFQEYATPVDRRYYVHNLEHGAVVLLYRCQDASGCPEIVAGLRAAIAALPNDPICINEGVRVRAILTPDPLLDVPLAVTAWGWIYKAGCLDPVSLKDFVRAHYGQGPEEYCGNGQVIFEQSVPDR